MRHLLLLALGLAPALASAATPKPSATPVDALLQDVRRTVLPNGLTVLTSRQPGTGVVAINTWVKAGYFHEPDEVAGMAHLFEHMFFKGSKKFPGAEQIGQAVSAAGGITNAGTIYDSTNYYFVLPKEGFARGVEIQADAILNPLFDPAELKKEAEVVIEESNRKLDNPPAVSMERMFATAFEKHRFRRWRIGSNEVLRNINRANLLAFFETLYRPENIVVTVSGDVDHAEALRAVTESFGVLPKGTLKKERGPQEPPQATFRYGQSNADLTQGYTVLGWPTVPENHADELVLEMLANILGGGRSSRLYQAAVGPDAANAANAFHFTFEDVGILGIQASFDEKNRAKVDDAVLREVARLRQHGPTAYEVALARNSMEMEVLQGVEDSLGRAQALSQAEARGSYRDLGTRLQRLATLSEAQVKDAARRYLTLEKLTVYHYQPKGAAAPGPEATLGAARTALSATAPAPAAVALPPATTVPRGAGADGAVQQLTLSNGVKVLVRERASAPLVSTGVFFRGGRAQETARNAGLTRLMTQVMRRGTTTRNGNQIDQAIEFYGSALGSALEEDYFGFTLDSSSRAFAPSLSVLADVLLHPTFPEDELSREKHLQLAAIKRSMDSGVERPLQLYHEALYGDHPYGRDERGDAQSVEALDRAAVAAWWKQSVVADGATIVVVGDVAAADVKQALEKELGALPRGTAAAPVQVPVSLPASREKTEQRDRKQTAMVIGFPTVAPGHADYPALRLLQSVTSGLSGTFFAELRGKRSLAYTVFAQAEALARHGSYLAYLASEAGKEAEARTALLAELKRLQGDGVQAADVERAKSYFAGTVKINRQTNAAQRDEIALSLHRDLGHDFIDRLLERMKTLTAEDLRTVAARYFAGDNHVFAAVRGQAATAASK